MIFFAESNKGHIREINEDNYCAGTMYSGSAFYFAVADGMGGHKAGEVASRVAVEMFTERLPFVEETETKSAGKCLTEIIEKANRKILNTADTVPEYAGMGTTAVIGTVSVDNVLTVGNAGDSRAYIFTEGELVQITVDHTYVEYLVSCGILPRDKASQHPDRNMITKALGLDEVADPDIFTMELKKEDMLLVCSDGLYEMISDEEIKNVFISNVKDVENICHDLVRLALEAGGTDNVTVIVAEI